MITDELLFRYFSKETSQSEDRLIRKWLDQHPEQADRIRYLQELYEAPDPFVSDESIQSDWLILDGKLANSPKLAKRSISLTARITRIAAILLFLAGSGMILYHQSTHHVLRNRDLNAKSIVLPDGTQVDLGPRSKLEYNKNFNKGERLIRITGEAFFDVTSDPAQPFTVMVGEARVKVTGTQFVVSTSPGNEEIEVSVRSGNVLFYNSETLDKNAFRMGLVAGEKGIFYPTLNRMDKTRDPYFQTTP